MNRVLETFFDLVYGCKPKNLSFPFSVKPGHRRCPAAMQTGTYVVCLNCDKEPGYDWSEMRMMIQDKRMAHAGSVSTLSAEVG